MNAFKNKKVIILITITTALITLISASFNFWVSMYVAYRFNINSDKASSIGIIGGADGPTSIFIAGIPSSNSVTIVFALLSIIGFLYLISMKKFKK
jgi:Na+-transporting methylmalonyl-CoA/oxaloacetate decarboxylase beta subunit